MFKTIWHYIKAFFGTILFSVISLIYIVFYPLFSDKKTVKANLREYPYIIEDLWVRKSKYFEVYGEFDDQK